jgi:hypothetical protein
VKPQDKQAKKLFSILTFEVKVERNDRPFGLKKALGVI